MNDIENLFNKYTINETLHENFEDMVYSKIKKKKMVKKVAYSCVSIFLIFSALFTYTLFIKNTPSPESFAKKTTFKEEVPVIEDVIFASSDSRTYYSIERVSYTENDNDI